MTKKVGLILGATVILLIGLLAVAGYVGASAVVGNHPEWRKISATPQDFGLPSRVIEFDSLDGIRLKAWWLPGHGTTPRGTVLLAHGSMQNRSGMLPRAAFLVRAGYNVMDLDLRAHGESRGNYMTPGYFESHDILGALRYTRERLQIRGPLAVMGFSYGAVAAIHAAAQSPEIAAVIADGAFMSMLDAYERQRNLALSDPQVSSAAKLALKLSRMPLTMEAMRLVFYVRTGVTLSEEEADALPQIGKLGQRPILFIAGEQDRIAPPENARKMYEAARSPRKQLRVIKGASHNRTYAAAPAEYEATVLKFLEAALPRN